MYQEADFATHVVFCTEYPLAVIIDQIYTVESVFSNWTPFLPPLCTLQTCLKAKHACQIAKHSYV